MKSVVERAEVNHEANKSFLVLIPKGDKPFSIKIFRPISLCNVCIKLALKMIVHRLKNIWGRLVSTDQGAFVHGRQSVDNIIVCQEIVNSLKHTTARRGGMILKLDLEKAFDRMSGKFVEEALFEAHLPTSLVQTIMQIITSSSYRLE